MTQKKMWLVDDESWSLPPVVEQGTEAGLDQSTEEPQGEVAQCHRFASEIHVSRTWSAASGLKSDLGSAGHCLAQ